jgi:hypothetical protein
MATKTREKPRTKLREWRKRGRRGRAALSSNASAPTKLARYTGTRGKTQGERKESNPPLRATMTGIFSILLI